MPFTTMLGVQSGPCAAAVAGLIVVLLVGAPLAAQPLSGDCDGNGSVEPRELVRVVEMALRGKVDDACRRADANSDGSVALSEILATVGAAQSRPARLAERYRGYGETINVCNDPSSSSAEAIPVLVIFVVEQIGRDFRSEIREPAREEVIALDGRMGASGGLAGTFGFRDMPLAPLRAAHHSFILDGTFTGTAGDDSLRLVLEGTFTAGTLVCQTRISIQAVALR